MNTATENTSDERTEYIAGLRELADLYEANPHLKLPVHGTSVWLPLSVHVMRTEGQREQLAEWTRVIPGKKTKQEDGLNGEYFSVGGKLAGLHLKVIAERDEVCERVVVATREVTEEVPDPEALAAVPTVSVTKTVEDVVWECRSILDDRNAVSTGVSA